MVSGIPGEQEIHVWDIRNEGVAKLVAARVPREFKGTRNPFFAERFRVNLSADGRLLAVWNRNAAALVNADDLQKWQLARYLPLPLEDKHWIVGFIPGSEDLVSVNANGVWRHTFEEPATVLLYSHKSDELFHCDMSRDGKYIALAMKGVVEIIDGPAALREPN